MGRVRGVRGTAPSALLSGEWLYHTRGLERDGRVKYTITTEKKVVLAFAPIGMPYHRYPV